MQGSVFLSADFQTPRHKQLSKYTLKKPWRQDFLEVEIMSKQLFKSGVNGCFVFSEIG